MESCSSVWEFGGANLLRHKLLEEQCEYLLLTYQVTVYSICLFWGL